MGYLREKYTKAYYLHKDDAGRELPYGVAGVTDFERGEIRNEDLDVLERLDFRGKRVLDIGCGRGEALHYAAAHGAGEVYGVDFSDDAITIAREFLQRVGANAELHCADALDFICKWGERKDERRFDIVLMLDCVEHIPRTELAVLLKGLLPLMTERSILAVNTPHFGADNDVITEGLKPEARDSSDEHEATQGMHCNRYTRSSLKRFMRAQGFVAISHHLFAPHLRLSKLSEGTRRARRRAAKAGYPVLLPRALAPEFYSGWSWWHHTAMKPLIAAKRGLGALMPRGLKRAMLAIMPAWVKRRIPY